MKATVEEISAALRYVIDAAKSYAAKTGGIRFVKATIRRPFFGTDRHCERGMLYVRVSFGDLECLHHDNVVLERDYRACLDVHCSLIEEKVYGRGGARWRRTTPAPEKKR